MNWTFLTQLPHPIGVPGGGVGNGLLGTIIVIGLATAMAVPLGLLTGIYLALFGRGPIPEALRFLSDVLSGVPSIAIGLFAYAVLVAPLKHFSGFSASFAFMMLMLPLLVRTSEQAIRSVPQTVREGALALGMSNFRATVYIVLPTARPAIITALLLAIARVTGETAPLLFTAFGSAVLGGESEPADGGARAASLQLRDLAVSRVAAAGVGRRVPAGARGAGAQPRRALHAEPRDAGARELTAAPALDQLLATDDLSAYYGERKAVGNVTIGFARKAVTALIGPSGCGKTTLLRCLNRIHEVALRRARAGPRAARRAGHLRRRRGPDVHPPAHRHGVPAARTRSRRSRSSITRWRARRAA